MDRTRFHKALHLMSVWCKLMYHHHPAHLIQISTLLLRNLRLDLLSYTNTNIQYLPNTALEVSAEVTPVSRGTRFCFLLRASAGDSATNGGRALRSSSPSTLAPAPAHQYHSCIFAKSVLLLLPHLYLFLQFT